MIFRSDDVLANRQEDNQVHGINSFLYTSNGQRLYKDATNLSKETLAKIDQAVAHGTIHDTLSKDFYIKKTNHCQRRSVPGFAVKKGDLAGYFFQRHLDL